MEILFNPLTVSYTHLDVYKRQVLARARDRIELETLNAASNGDTDSRITLARLAKFGYSTKIEQDTKAELTVKWEGVDTSDIEAWGK